MVTQKCSRTILLDKIFLILLSGSGTAILFCPFFNKPSKLFYAGVALGIMSVIIWLISIFVFTTDLRKMGYCWIRFDDSKLLRKYLFFDSSRIPAKDDLLRIIPDYKDGDIISLLKSYHRYCEIIKQCDIGEKSDQSLFLALQKIYMQLENKKEFDRRQRDYLWIENLFLTPILLWLIFVGFWCFGHTYNKHLSFIYFLIPLFLLAIIFPLSLGYNLMYLRRLGYSFLGFAGVWKLSRQYKARHFLILPSAKDLQENDILVPSKEEQLQCLIGTWLVIDRMKYLNMF